MSDFDEDMARGHLENGEPLEARWGAGEWSDWGREQEPDWDGGECPFCHDTAWYFGGQFAECQKCGKTYEDIE